MSETIKEGLFALTKAFNPSDVQNLEDSYRIILGIVELGKKPVPFSLNDLVQYTKENFTPPVPIDNKVVDDILAKLEQQKLIEQPTLGNYTISILSRESINEFFSLRLQPRLGKTGRFSYYLLMDKNKLREVQWCCIYLTSNNRPPITPKTIVEISKLTQSEVRKNLGEMVNRDQLKKDFTWVKNKQEELFHELFWDYYQNYRDSKPTIKDFVFQIILRHSNISREEIHKHLRNQGIICSKRIVQKALAGLINDNMIRRIGLENSGDNKVDYELSPECIDLYRKSMIKEITVILKNAGFHVEDEFFDELKKHNQPLSSINTFLDQLSFLIVQSEEEVASCHLWQTFFSNLPMKSFPTSIADFISNSSEADRLEELKNIVKSSKISPAVLCSIKYFQSSSK